MNFPIKIVYLLCFSATVNKPKNVLALLLFLALSPCVVVY
uniref:Uncharacterized protein n=1 Tax=Rhizophora mucronata TaxID=61149 RepID=A0A2P2P396_RHIMU